jgi:uncharacterized protein YodC (DUF2158 family)
MPAKFKVGDIVECIENSHLGFPGFVGQRFTVSKTISGGLNFEGYSQELDESCDPHRFKLVERKMKEYQFKRDDKVKKKSGETFSNGKEVVTVDRVDSYERVWFKETGTNMEASALELDKMVKYEDKWRLNDGSVDIPDDAEKLMNPEGTSVVAFRYVKEPNVVVQTKYFYGQMGKFYTTDIAQDQTHTKIDLIFTDGELTDIQWEKL